MKAHIREMIIVNLETRLEVKREKNVKRDSKGHKEGHRIKANYRSGWTRETLGEDNRKNKLKA